MKYNKLNVDKMTIDETFEDKRPNDCRRNDMLSSLHKLNSLQCLTM